MAKSHTAHEILTVSALAEYLRCHPSSIYRLLKAGAIPAFKLGADWRFLVWSWCAAIFGSSGRRIWKRLCLPKIQTLT
jgi:excisionase family DNA binding protein